MRNRIIFGAILFVAALGIILSGKLAVSIAISAIALVALFEMYKSLGFLKNQKILSIAGFVFGFCVMLFAVIKSVTQSLDFNAFTHLVFKGAIIFGVFMLIYMVLRFEKVHFSTVSCVFLVTMYITVFLAHIILINSQKYGNAVIWLVFLGAWGTDTVAYFAGRFFGKHKLIEKVSPKKTVEGAIGGSLGAVIIYVVYGLILSKIGFCVNYVNLIITAVFVSVISQFGDLIASCIKRENNIKDYGYIIPGHGGILDRFDSVILVSPFVFYLGMYLPVIA